MLDLFVNVSSREVEKGGDETIFLKMSRLNARNTFLLRTRRDDTREERNRDNVRHRIFRDDCENIVNE